MERPGAGANSGVHSVQHGCGQDAVQNVVGAGVF